MPDTLPTPSDLEETPTLVPARMLNEFAYCPRLGYLMWAEQEFRETADTLEGTWKHKRVDRKGGATLPEAPPTEDVEEGEEENEDAPPRPVRSVTLSSETLGLIARMDLVEVRGNACVPIDYKRGKRPVRDDDPPRLVRGVWEPERIQVCAQALLLREHGWEVEEGAIYYVESRSRATIQITDALVKRTLQVLDEFRQAVADPQPPPPLVDSPKCPRCALVTICLPDEVTLLREQGVAEEPDEDGAIGGASQDTTTEPRRLLPSRADALPLFVQAHGAKVGKKGGCLKIDIAARDRTPEDGTPTKTEVKLKDVSSLNLYGNINVTTPATRELLRRGAPICHFSHGGWFYGITHGHGSKNVHLRRRQYATAEDDAASAALARRFVAGKIANCRAFIRRNHSGFSDQDFKEMKRLAVRALETEAIDTLLGLEGAAGRIYFQNFPGMIKASWVKERDEFRMDGRNRRPPTDPVNAMLSYGYGLLVKDLTVTLMKVGLDPYLGFYHQPRFGRPSLALDVMEEFRPLVVDSAVLWALNNGVVNPRMFVRAAGAVNMDERGRKRMIQAYSRRMEELVTHPVFGYRISYRRVLEVQCRLLSRRLVGDIPDYMPFRIR